MIDMYKQVPDTTAFVRGDGSRLHSLKALEMALLTMHEGEFNHHVGGGKNDFANWVQGVFGHTDLANRLRKAQGRIDMLAVLDEAARQNLTRATKGSQMAPLSPSAAAAVVTPSKSKKLQEKLHGIFRKGDAPLAHAHASHAGHLKPSTASTAPSTSGYSLASHIDHLDRELAHLTRHHAHSFSRQNVGSSTTEESIKERILDFALGLIVGLMLGFVLAKSMGL